MLRFCGKFDELTMFGREGREDLREMSGTGVGEQSHVGGEGLLRKVERKWIGCPWKPRGGGVVLEEGC